MNNYYNTCPDCGAALDPGERCDCRDKAVISYYKYIRIEEMAQKPKTKVFGVFNKNSGDCLGTIEWYGPWRQYCFLPFSDTVYSFGCMNDIAGFIKTIMDNRNKKPKVGAV